MILQMRAVTRRCAEGAVGGLRADETPHRTSRKRAALIRPTLVTLPRRHAQRAIQANDLAVEISIAHHVQHELGEFARLAEALRERH
jgi:hypothetical protein